MCLFQQGLSTLIWFVVLLENKTVLYKGSNCTLKNLVPPHPALLSIQYSLKATLYSRHLSKALWLQCYDKINQNEIQDLIITKCRRFSKQRREIKSKWKTGKYLDLVQNWRKKWRRWKWQFYPLLSAHWEQSWRDLLSLDLHTYN